VERKRHEPGRRSRSSVRLCQRSGKSQRGLRGLWSPGRRPHKAALGSTSIFSSYRGLDRSEPVGQRHELFDKVNVQAPNLHKYPERALIEAMSNALAHRDYELPDPIRVTSFANRIEYDSPGSLPLGVDLETVRRGGSGARWRNQSLAWIFNRLRLAQAEGQGIPTILRTMREEGCPPPTLETTPVSVRWVLPANQWVVEIERREPGSG
jgi:ATP-dependent DNA helicase RecG